MLKCIKDLDIEEKRVIVREDFNVPMENGNITDDTKILAGLDTILYLVKAKAKVILMTHLGRPNGEPNAELSTKIVAERLSELLPSTKVYFVKSCTGSEVESVINFAKPSEILVLENLRFYKGEENCDLEFAKQLAHLGDIFINDAFAVSHRKHSSVYLLPQLLPSAAGFSLYREIEAVDSFLNNSEQPKTCIIGGAKVSTKLPVIKNILDKVDTLVLGGGIAVSFAQVVYNMHVLDPFNSRQYESEIISLFNSKKIYIPDDFRGLANDELATFDIYNMVDNMLALDIGPKSQDKIIDMIQHSKTVLWNGPVGRFEDDRFAEGTKCIAEKIAINTANKNIKSIIGGGDTIAAINRFGYGKCATCMSTAGGAFLEYLEGKELPGIDVISIRI